MGDRWCLTCGDLTREGICACIERGWRPEQPPRGAVHRVFRSPLLRGELRSVAESNAIAGEFEVPHV